MLSDQTKQRFDRVALFRSFGKFIENLRGHYITAEDSGTGLEDMEIIRTQTKHVTGIDPSHGGSGDPSPFTALGVRRGIEAAVKFKLGRNSLEGVHVAVQGVGHVGYYLCKELHAVGAKLTVADVDKLKSERAQREFGAFVPALKTNGLDFAAGTATTMVGFPGDGYSDGPVAQARFSRPVAIAQDAHGALYVADAHPWAVRKVIP